MGLFEIEGATMVNWTFRVRAHTEHDALEEAQRIATWIDVSSSLAEVKEAQHRIARCRLIDPENE